jgi:hypothetical protein
MVKVAGRSALVQIAPSSQQITPYAGLVLVRELAARLGLAELLDQVTVKQRKRGYTPAQAILALPETPPGARPPRDEGTVGGEGRTDRGGARGEAVGPLRDGRARSRRPRLGLRRGAARAPARTAAVAGAISRGPNWPSVGSAQQNHGSVSRGLPSTEPHRTGSGLRAGPSARPAAS